LICIAKWNTATSTWSALDKGLNSTVYALAVSGSGDLYVGGAFTNVGSGGTAVTGLNNIAKWNTATSTWSALDKGLNSTVYALAVSGSDVYFGGQFTAVGSGGTAVTGLNNIAKWVVAATPTITSTATLTPFTACAGTASTQQSFSVSGSNLTANITVTAPTGFEVRQASSGNKEFTFRPSFTISQSGGSVASTTVQVRMASTATGTPSGNVTLTSTDATDKTVAVSGTVNSPANVTSGPPVNPSRCEGDNITWSITATGTITGYQWKKGTTDLTGQTGASLTLNNLTAADAGQYSVEARAACGNESYGPINLTVNLKPTITLGSISSISTIATSFSIPYTATTGSPNQYSLVAGTPTAMPSFSAVGNATLGPGSISVTIPSSAANTYNFNLTVSNNTGCVSAAVPVALVVTVANSLIIDRAISPTNCTTPNGSIVFRSIGYASTTQTLSYRKDGTATTASVMVESNGAISLTGLGAGVYSEFAIGSVAATGSRTLTAPSYSFAIGSGTNPTTCSGNGSIRFTTTLPGGTYTITFKKGGVDQTGIPVMVSSPIRVSAGATSSNSFILSGITAGTYTDFKIMYNGCEVTAAGPVELIGQPLPTAFSVTGGGTSFCGNHLFISTAGSQSGVNYQLKRNNINFGNPLEGTGNPLTFPAISQAGTYTVSATSTLGNCTQEMNGAALIQVLNTPSAFNLTGGGTSCSGAPVGIALSNSQLGVQYQLKRGTNLVGSPVSGTGSTLSFPAQNTAGTYTAVALSQCADLIMNNTVTINSVVTPGVFNVTGGGTTCGTALPVGLSGSQSGVFYQLLRNDAPVGTTVQGTGNAISLGNHLTAGQYTVIATRAGQCATSMGSVLINLISPPTSFNVTGGGTACSQGVDIGLSGSQSGVSYQLKRGSALVSTLQGNGNPLSFGNQTVAGTYTVEANVAGNCAKTMNANAVVTSGGTLPTGYDMTGGGPFCNNKPLPLGLSDSQKGVYYQLQRASANGFVNVGTTVQGNGNAISLGNHSIIGQYRVVVNSACLTIIGSTSITNCVVRMAAQESVEPMDFATVMPNPISNTLRLKVLEAKGQNVKVTLVDAAGRSLIQRAFVPETNQHQEELEVSQLNNGMYFLRVNTTDKQATLKVIKVQ